MSRPAGPNRSPTLRLIELQLGRSIGETRRALGWTQEKLGDRASVSRSMVGKVEAGANNASLRVLVALTDALAIRVELRLEAPFLADRARQREPAHARCVGHVRKRLELAGWRTASEVLVESGRSRGWIDVAAYEPRRRTLLIGEIKTELSDLGALERQLGWYEREAWSVARRLEWPTARLVSIVLILATEANERRLKANRELLAMSYPLRAAEVAARLSDPSLDWPSPARGLVMIDPLSRRADWLRPTRIDGRRRAAPYADYADFMTQAWPRR